MRTKKENGEKYIRGSQNIEVDGNKLSDEEFDKLTNSVEGNIRISYTVCESDLNPTKLFDLDELVAF